MIKHILAAVDGSPYTRGVGGWSRWLARKLGGELTALHVVDIVSLEGPFLHDLSGSLGFEPFLNFSAKMKEALTSNGEALLSSFKEECEQAGIACETSISFGIVANEIAEKAKLGDLVVLGRRGVNARFDYGTLGSVAERVIRRSPVPVLVVEEEFREPERPLLCYDGSPNSAKVMHSAVELVKELALPITVLTVAEEGEELVKEAEEYIKPYDIEFECVVLEGDPPTTIEKFCREKGNDLVFMGASHHSRLVEMVLGSTAEYLVRNLSVAVFLEH